ncbi:MAG: hypothetical protein R3C40_12190 [Parvularculaceae bacterium]
MLIAFALEWRDTLPLITASPASVILAMAGRSPRRYISGPLLRLSLSAVKIGAACHQERVALIGDILE